jgi:drug/metabolite transporter (DMT)-like permease
LRLQNLTSNARAVLWVTASVALFSIVFASGKFAADTASALQILFLRYIGGFVTLLCIVCISGVELKSYVSDKPRMHLLRAGLGSYGGVAAIYAATHMPIVDATAIGLLDAVILVFLGILFLQERVSALHWLAIALCLVGAMIMLASKGIFQNVGAGYLVPASIALLSAILIALESLMIKKLTSSEQAMTVLLYVNAFGIVLLLIPACIFWQSTGFIDNLPFLLLGPLAILAQYLTIRGYRMADVAIVGPVNYTWIIFAAMIGYFWFGEVPTQGVIAGAVLIVFGGILLALQKRALPERPAELPVVGASDIGIDTLGK